MNPILLAQSGPLAGQRFELAPGATTLGREAGNTIVIADQSVSRNHARITVAALVATLEDVGSSGGTFLNEARLSGPTILKVGDTIRLGGTAFSFTPAASVSPMGVTATMPSRSGRKREVGSAEAAQPTAPVMPSSYSSNPGCMPDFSHIFKDIEGCLPWLLRILIILVIVAVVVGIIGGIILCGVAGVGTLSGAAGATGGAAHPAAGGGSGSSGGSPPPPDQQQQQQQPTQPANGAIQIIAVKATHVAREGYLSPVPVVLLTWKNVGANAVVEVFGDITAFDKQGTVIGIQKGVRIYTGPAVAAGSTHTDDEQKEGELLTLDQGKDQALDHATVTPAEIRVQAPPPQTDDE